MNKNSNKNPGKKFVSLSRDYYVYAGFILFIVICSSLWSVIALYNSQKLALQDQLTSQSQLIDTSLSNYLNYVSHIAEDKGHKIALKGGNLEYTSDLFKRNFFFSITKSGLKKKAFLWPHFSWIDAKGNILVKSEIGILPKAEPAKNSQHLYQSSINNWQLNLSNPYYDETEDKTFIDASLGISDLNNEKYIGAIATKFNIEKLIEAIKIDLKADTKFIVLNEGLKIIMESDNNQINNDDFFVNKLANVNPEAELEVLKNHLEYHGNVYRIYKKSSNYPFIILTGYNANSFNKEFIISLTQRFLAVFTAAFFVIIILFFQRKSLINKERENKAKLVELNNKLEHQNQLAKKSTKSREKFLSETRQNIIEDTVIKITKDMAKILDHLEGNVLMTKQTVIDLHKKILGACAKILSYVSDNLNLSYVNIKKIIEEAIDMAHYDASLNNVVLTSDIAKKIDDIYVDERSIKHVIIALINYAMEDKKRDEKNSFIKIRAKSIKKQNGQFLEITFEDNGHGISEEMRMEFKQSAAKEGKNENNTSLSLYAIRSILAAHQATLEINNMIAKGSVMTIQIPYNSPKSNTPEITKPKTKNIDNIVQLFPKK